MRGAVVRVEGSTAHVEPIDVKEPDGKSERWMTRAHAEYDPRRGMTGIRCRRAPSLVDGYRAKTARTARKPRLTFPTAQAGLGFIRYRRAQGRARNLRKLKPPRVQASQRDRTPAMTRDEGE